MRGVPDTVWTAIIGAIVTLSMAWMNKSTAKKLNDISNVGNANHVLLNSNMSAALKLTCELSEWKLNELKRVPGNPSDLAVAEVAAGLARKNYDEHMIKQNAVDSMVARQEEKKGILG